MDRAASQEYFTTVKSLGNAVINCTDRDITVDRRADLKVGSQDNLGGEISGTIALTGTINVSGSVTAGVTGEGSIEFKTPLLDKGPTTAIKGTGTATGEGTVTGAVGASAAFTGAFKANYLKTWTTEQTDSTNYHMTVKGGDALVFGASVALPPFSGNATSATTQVQGWTIRYPNRLSGTESRHPDKAVALLLRNSSTNDHTAAQRLRGVRPGAKVTVTFDDSAGSTGNACTTAQLAKARPTPSRARAARRPSTNRCSASRPSPPSTTGTAAP